MRTEKEIRKYLENKALDDGGRGDWSDGFSAGRRDALEWVLEPPEEPTPEDYAENDPPYGTFQGEE